MKKPTYQVVNGFTLSAQFPAEHFLSALEYKPDDSDIFVCTYPKCGTTWMQHIVWLILKEGQPLAADKKMTHVFPFMETVGKEYVALLPQPRLIKSHLPLRLLHFNPKTKYIYVARNPFDCVVSYYYHTKGFPMYFDFADGTFDDFFELFIKGETDFGDYFDHVLPWFALRDQPNVLFITYEELSLDFEVQLVRIMRFLGKEQLLQRSDVLAQISRHSSFEQMSEDQSRWTNATRPQELPFVRKGIVGDWKNVMSPLQYQRLHEKWIERSGNTGFYELFRSFLQI